MHETRLALKPHVLLERDGDEDDIVLIDSHTGRMSACNETASLVVAELQRGSTVARLVEAVMSRYKVADEVATRDVNAVLDVLTYEGLLDTRE
jgi:gamma-glutamyl phosphate reductase